MTSRSTSSIVIANIFSVSDQRPYLAIQGLHGLKKNSIVAIEDRIGISLTFFT